MEFGCIGAPLEVKFADEEKAAPGIFEGYASVFGVTDSHGDVVEPGAYSASLLARERAGRPLPPMYKMHGAMTGNPHEPVGVWEAMSEDANGLHVKGRLVGLDTEQGKWTYAQLKEGALRGLSIGFRVPPNGAKRGSDRPGEPKRFLKMIHLREVSLVDDPSNALSRVYAMKSHHEMVDRLADPLFCRALEAKLRQDPVSLSSAAAVKVVALVKAHLRDGDDFEPDVLRDEAAAAELVAALTKAADRIRA